MTACVVCNDAVLQKKEEDWVIMGDPTEGALLVVAGKAGLFQKEIDSKYSRVAEFPFDSERKRMNVIVSEQSTSSIAVFVKGSPESLLERCTQIQNGDHAQPLTPEICDRILEKNNYLARRGLRVLGFAYKSLEKIPKTEKEAEQNLIWLGLVGMLDAPRPEVREAVNRCHLAGIRPVMITGDHPLTAQAIAGDLGIISSSNHNLVLTGQELETYSDRELDQLVKKINVYARVSSHHKLRIVQALRRQNQVIAMTGDGVNDAPALKQADIGVAMGITGTDVTKEASDMVLLDDNFATIIAAIEEGRVVYNNIRRFIRYILGSNIGEMLTIASVPLLGLTALPLSPLQILWMNLVTDGVPALALAVEPGHSSIMRESPKNPQEGIFARGLGFYLIRVGLVLATVAISLMVWAYGYTPLHTNDGTLDGDRWKTMVFTMLCLSQMGHALAVRSLSRMTIELNPFSNPFLLISIIVTSLLQLSLVYVEPLREFFGTQYLPLNELLICLGFSSLIFVWVEIEKFVYRLYRSRQKRH
jgi:Ca2+-transporting ATPase